MYKSTVIKPKKVKYLAQEANLPDGDESIRESSDDEELPPPNEQ